MDGVIFIHTCIISNSSLLSCSTKYIYIYIYIYTCIYVWNEKKSQIQFISSRAIIVLNRFNCSSLIDFCHFYFIFFSFYVVSSCLSVSHGGAHILYRSEDHWKKKETVHMRKTKVSILSLTFNEKTKNMKSPTSKKKREAKYNLVLAIFRWTLLSTAYPISDGSHSRIEIYIYVYDDAYSACW